MQSRADLRSPKALRPYQVRIVANALQGNSIVVLPTGSGKTAIAADVIKRLPTGTKVLFLVPTCLLVDQQAQALREWSGLHIGEFMGGQPLPTGWDVLVSTPKAFLSKQPSAPSLAWDRFSLIVFDEVHHVLKEHPYRKIALLVKSLPEGGAPQILGLSASLTYAVTEQKVTATLEQLCRELRIKAMLTATSEELMKDGYQGNKASAELALDITENKDVSKGPPLEVRKPHMMHSIFFRRVKEGVTSPFISNLVELVRVLEDLLKTIDPSFSSPLAKSSLKEWGSYAHKRAKGPNAPLYRDMEHLYEALRLLVSSWEESDDLAASYLLMTLGENPGQAWSQPGQCAFQRYWVQLLELDFPRLERLKRVLLSKASGDFRGIVFVQQRITAHILQHFIQQDNDLSVIFCPGVIYATKTPATASFSVSESESKQRLAAFSTGRINVLVATVVAEEGMDVPAANCVIRFDSMVHAVSFVQGRGRARQEDSSFVVMAEREDRPVELLQQVEQQQQEIIHNFVPRETNAQDEKQLRVAQTSRENGAKGVILAPTLSPLEAINLFARKTKAPISERTEKSSQGFTSHLVYTSILRSSSASGSGSTSKLAKQAAAAILFEQLAVQLR